jgi:hypothetical protein
MTVTEFEIIVAEAMDKVRECQYAGRPLHKEIYSTFSTVADTILEAERPAEALERATKYVWYVYYDKRYEYRRTPNQQTHKEYVLAERLFLAFTGGVKYILRKRGWLVRLFDYKTGVGEVTLSQA